MISPGLRLAVIEFEGKGCSSRSAAAASTLIDKAGASQ